MARAVKLHPALIAVGVVVIGKLIGPIGLVVAVPILAAASILVNELWVEPLEARHLSGRGPPDDPGKSALVARPATE
jgi:predicted PurR-regulated permease PerM